MGENTTAVPKNNLAKADKIFVLELTGQDDHARYSSCNIYPRLLPAAP